MEKKEKLLNELVLALNYAGLNWYHILEDYLEDQAIRNLKPIEEMAELKKIVAEFQIGFSKDHIA